MDLQGLYARMGLKTDVEAPDPHRYKMDYPQLGTCLIINNKRFHPALGKVTRVESELDAANAMKTFSAMGYKVEVANDLTVQKMKDRLYKASQMDHSQNASFACVLMSHGEEGAIYGVDGCVNLEELTSCLKGNNCKSLVGKPKLFFIQASRGTKKQTGTVAQDGDGDEDKTPMIPLEADFLYAFSTPRGFKSHWDQIKGSWFMQALCEMLQTFSGNLELKQILVRVNHKVALSYEYKENDKTRPQKEVPCTVSLLTKELYFPKKIE